MTLATLFTLAFLPVYLFLRQPFRNLPLHIDTGFYVSNDTVVHRRWRFRKGWNAHFAGCSKLVPEMFYSLIYLFTVRHKGHRKAFLAVKNSREDRTPTSCRPNSSEPRIPVRSNAYPFSAYDSCSRLGASLFNYATAIAVGVLAAKLFPESVQAYYAGLIAFALVSSEPHWGVYFECAELFELLPQVLGLLCLSFGLETHQFFWMTAGSFLWAAEVFFVKLSSAPAWLLLFGGIGLMHPETIGPTAVGGAAALLSYLAWTRWNGQDPRQLLAPLRGHEAHFNPGLGWLVWSHRLREKGLCVFRVVRRQPLLVALALIGLLAGHPWPTWWWLYSGGIALGYLVQSADCRYYLIPFLAPLAVSTTGGILGLLELGSWGWGVLIVVAILWLLHNPMRAWRLNDADLNRWVWAGFRPVREIERNRTVAEAATFLRPRVEDRSLLVYGPCNQAYALLGASYPTPIIAPESYLDPMAPGWQYSLNQQLQITAPDFILDTANCFAAAEARDKLGLDYRLTHTFGGEMRFFEHQDNQTAHALRLLGESSNPDEASAHTYRLQTRQEIIAEEEQAGSGLCRHTIETYAERAQSDRPHHPQVPEDDQASALSALLNTLKSQGVHRLALYGAGRFTARYADVYRTSPIPITVVLDDNADRIGATFLEWPLRNPDEVDCSQFDGVVISTDRFAGPMLARARHHFGNGVPAFVPNTRL